MTEAHRKAQRAYQQSRREKGDTKVTFWLSPDGDKALAQLAQVYGSRQQAFEALLQCVKPASPVVAGAD